MRVAALAAAAILGAHAWFYFFLLDDFIITAQVSSKSVRQLLTQPQFNFYRPISDAWLKALFAAAGWDHPGLYIVMSLAVHGACAWLVRVLARMCGLESRTATLAAVIFFLSPWATEPILWVAASCDSLPAIGLLGCTIAGLALIADPTADAATSARHGIRWGIFSIGLVCAIEALLAKETGVLAPALVVLTIGCVRGWRRLRDPRAAAYIAALTLIVGVYLAFRQSILPGLGGGYGTIWTLFANSSIAHNARRFAIALFIPPHADLQSGVAGTVFRAAALLFALSTAALLILGALSRRRLALLCVAAALVCIAPVLWATLAPGNTSGNRFLYVPGIWFAILIAAGAEGRGRGLIPVILAVALASVYYQTRIWRDAFALSRATIAQMRPYDHSTAPIFITNLPTRFIDGPYVLNPLAIRSYFGASMPPIDANAMGLKFVRGATTFSFWRSEWREARSDERAVTLDLPVWTGESHPFGEIDAPAPAASLAQPFTVRGWTIDAGARDGTGVDSVRLYAQPLDASHEDATLLGIAAYGAPRPDVSRKFGERFLNSGFQLEVSGLRPGRYRFLVHTRRPLARGEDVPLTVDIVAR